MPLASVSREIDRRIPTAAKLTTSEEPPSLTKGSVMPVMGIKLSTTPILMSPWTASQAVMPVANRAPKVSGAASAMSTPR